MAAHPWIAPWRRQQQDLGSVPHVRARFEGIRAPLEGLPEHGVSALRLCKGFRPGTNVGAGLKAISLGEQTSGLRMEARRSDGPNASASAASSMAAMAVIHPPFRRGVVIPARPSSTGQSGSPHGPVQESVERSGRRPTRGSQRRRCPCSSRPTAYSLRHAPVHERPDHLRRFRHRLIQGEVTCIEDVDLGPRHVLLACFRLRHVEGRVVAAPNHQQRRLPLAQPCLPGRVSGRVGAVVVEQVELNPILARPGEGGGLIRPQVGVVPLGMRRGAAAWRRLGRSGSGAPSPRWRPGRPRTLCADPTTGRRCRRRAPPRSAQ